MAFVERRDLESLEFAETNDFEGMVQVLAFGYKRDIEGMGYMVFALKRGIEGMGQGIEDMGQGIEGVGQGIEDMGQGIQGMSQGIEGMGYMMAFGERMGLDCFGMSLD